MTAVFDLYAEYYDLLYGDKDYLKEVEYVAALLSEQPQQVVNVLELGCGTGKHAEHLARKGFVVCGVDQSEEMLVKAEQRKAGLEPDVAARLSFTRGDIRELRFNRRFDLVISLFHVVCYQTSNLDQQAVYDTAVAHLEPDGIFLFDFWYGPAVLTQRAEVRIKRFENDHVRMIRIAEPQLFEDKNVVVVNYTMIVTDKQKNQTEIFKESHPMRYLFAPEISFFASRYLNLCALLEWGTKDPVNCQSWSGLALLKRVV